MTTVKELYAALEARIPSSLSLEWDNDGLMLCADSDLKADRVLCALDCDGGAVEKAIEYGCGAIVTHHPLIFKPLKRVTDKKLISLIKNDIAVMSFHTRLDIMDGGVNDRLAQMLGLNETCKFAENAGRIGCVTAMSFTQMVERLKTRVGDGVYRLSDTGRKIKKIAVVSGSGGDFTGEAAENGAELFISGEIGYHHTLDAYEAGMSCIEIGHEVSERHAPSILADIIKEELPSVKLITM